MSADQSIRSESARRTLSRFASGLWTVGAVAMALVAFSTFARLEWDPQTGALLDTGGGANGGYYPWEDENPTEAQVSYGNAYSGVGSGVVRIEGVTGEPLQITQITDTNVRLSMTESGDIDPATPLTDGEWPLRVGSPDGDLPSVVFPSAGTLELWVQVEGSEQWVLEIDPLDAEEITDVVSGTGNRLLVYSGSAASALFEFAGDGIFFVTAYTREEGEESIIIEADPLKERHSWQPSDVVVLAIESDAERGAWSVDIDPTGDETAAPTPSASPSPTEQE